MRKSEKAKLTTKRFDGVLSPCHEYQICIMKNKKLINLIIRQKTQANTYLGGRENVDDHSITNDGDQTEDADCEAQESMPQGVHGRELVPTKRKDKNVISLLSVNV